MFFSHRRKSFDCSSIIFDNVFQKVRLVAELILFNCFLFENWQDRRCFQQPEHNFRKWTSDFETYSHLLLLPVENETSIFDSFWQIYLLVSNDDTILFATVSWAILLTISERNSTKISWNMFWNYSIHISAQKMLKKLIFVWFISWLI